jgi:prolyl-tRNA editing enzyme YbaK/EbsC (Cys-tRNA(Pro) deacylase)
VRSGKAILIVAGGAHRISEGAVAELTGEPIEKATAAFVRESTGFAIGGVPPAGFAKPLETWIDRALLRYPQVWAAAGTPNSVFCIEPQLLPSITGGEFADVA